MIDLINVSKTYSDGSTVLRNINLHIARGELAVLIGPSGCGKTTTMKMINRLLQPTSGEIKIKGKSIEDFNAVELRRNIGYVVQSIGLFPHMTIAQNVTAVLNLKGAPPQDCDKKARELLELVGLPPETYLTRYPHELSGGQQQRVGVARALAADPEIILMDEPFGALDPITRESLQDELLRLQKEMHKTIVFVTHDMDEAIKLGDRIIVLKDGQILQADTPEKLMSNPAHGFVEEFMGSRRLVQQPEMIPVREMMIANPVVCPPNITLQKALQRMQQGKVDSLLVVDDRHRLQGIVTALDIHRQSGETKQVHEIMMPPRMTVKSDENLRTAINMMAEYNLNFLPVVAGEELVLQGLITRGSLVKVWAQTI